MAIEKKVYVDQTEVLRSGIVQVRTRTDVVEDGIVIGSSLHRHTIAPGDDYSQESEQVQAICSAAHTQEVIEAFNAAIAAQGV